MNVGEILLKLWNDSGSANRPKSIQVDIYKDQVLFETVTLSSENDWSYQWHTVDSGSQWTVTEKNVPNGYTVSISESEGIFTVTNSIKPSNQEPPKTGDTFPLWYYLVAMWLSGFLLLSMGILRQRKRK